MIRVLTALVLALLVSGCVTARNFANPRERITPGTAYTLARGDTEIGASLLGPGVTDLGASLGVRHGFGRRWQAGVNLAHATLGVFTVHGKVSVVDYHHFGFGVDAGVVYARPSLIWALPERVKKPIDELDVVYVPVTARFSFPVNQWFGAHAGLGYSHAGVFGPIKTGDKLLEAGLGVRQLALSPVVHFYPGQRVAFVAGASLPLYAAARLDVTGRSDVQPGVVLGVVSSEWKRLPFANLVRYHAGIETRFGRARHTHVQLLVARSVLNQAEITPPVFPSIRAYWRF